MANENNDKMIEGMYQKDQNVGYGLGGINGMHHDELGWDNTSVGMASSVFDNVLTQNGVRTYDPNYIGALEPIRAGRFIVKWLKIPTFFNTTATKYLKFFLENAVKSVSGLQDNSIAEAGTVTFGANQQEMGFPGGMKENNKNVTLTTITCTGDGCGKLMHYWQYGITDPQTQIHHMYGKDLRFIRPNYCGTLMYIFLGPTARPGDIEYSCIWNEVWPSGPDYKSSWESQEIGSDQIISERTVEFSGIFQDGPECNILAKYIVAGAGLAGQSYFDQMLPAYMYDKYINKIATKDKDTVDGLSMTQEKKLNGMSDVYTTDVIGIRKDAITKYGLDSSQTPSKLDSMSIGGTGGNIDQVNGFGTYKYVDTTKTTTSN